MNSQDNYSKNLNAIVRAGFLTEKGLCTEIMLSLKRVWFRTMIYKMHLSLMWSLKHNL